MSGLQLVLPGQVIATSTAESAEEDKFLRGHGTYVETSETEDRLIASVCGTVQRVNKLVLVVPVAPTVYQGQVGDLIVGRVSEVGLSRWKISLGEQCRHGQLPLSGIHLTGGAQRIRTAQDQRDMRYYLQEGDLVSAQVHKVQPADGSLMLHSRSYRYSKLENGMLVTVPPSLIPRRKNHFITMINDTLDALWGCNGYIWIQRKLPSPSQDSEKELALLQEQLRKEHADTPVTVEERQSMARLKNAIECLRIVHCMVTPESAELIYEASVQKGMNPAQMMIPENVIELTSFVRRETES